MTKEQFKNHSWKIGETVYIVTQVEIVGHRFMHRILQTTVSSIRTIVDFNINGSQTFTSIHLNIPNNLDFNERIDCFFHLAGITDATCESIFISSSQASKALQKKKKQYRDIERIGAARVSIFNAIKRMEENVNNQWKLYKELLVKFNLEE